MIELRWLDQFFTEKTPEDINVKLREILHEIYEKIHINEDRILYVGLYGSQNYLLNGPNSDIDCECFIFPSKDDIIFGHQLYSTCITTPYGTCHVKDIRMAFNELRKASPNILEVLATLHALINKEYEHTIRMIDGYINYFATLNPYRLIHGLEGLLRRYEKDIENPKYFANYIRMLNMIEGTIHGDSYKSLIIPDNHEYLKNLKYSKNISNNTMEVIKNKAETIKATMEDFYTYAPKDSNEGVLGTINFCEAELMTKYIKLVF